MARVLMTGKDIVLVCASALLFLARPAAAGDYFFDPDHSVIEGKISYAAIGTYKATFKTFRGVVSCDDARETIRNVELRINAASLRSRHPRLDNIVRSRMILDVARYPEIHFQSKDIKRQGDAFIVTGILDLHGVKKEMSFPFTVHERSGDRERGKVIQFQGTWVINRKDFAVIWNKVLDHGGIVVGNHITIDWKIEATPSPGGNAS